MTAGIDGDHGQTSLWKRHAGMPSNDERDETLPTEPSVPDERTSPGRRRRQDNLAIGAPLTAAFIGGFLVIENLAGADPLGDVGMAAAPDDGLALDGEGGDGGDGALAAGRSTAGAAGAGENGASAGDPSAAPVEDVALLGEVGEAAIGAGGAAIAATASGLIQDSGGEGGGIEANLTLLDIDIASGEDAEIDGFVEDEVIARNRQFGTNGDDVLIGTDGADAISGGEGDDIIQGLGGSDVLNGNGGDDQLFGGSGRDTLSGGFGDDLLDGGDDGDLDLLQGGGGDDVLIVNGTTDIALESNASGGSGGNDLQIVRASIDDDLPSGADGFTFAFAENLGIDLPDGTEGARRLVGNNIENVTLQGSADHDIIADSYANRLTGNSGDNLIRAGAGDDIVTGGGGRDDLSGDEGNDRIEGGAGDDLISGGLGQDALFGEGGDDVYVIGLNDSAIDTVFDHEGANRLQLEGVTDETVEASLLGDDLYVLVDGTPVAQVSDYVGHEDALAGVDFGQGLRSVDTLLVDHPDLESTIAEAERNAAEAASDDLLAAHLDLSEPTILGAARTDERLDGTDGADWLSGFDGKDTLFGHEGNDILEGGDGRDDLRGGAGDDRYLFSKGESGIDQIQDSEGRNIAELQGYDSAKIEGAMLGDDLAVLADGKVLFTVDDFAANQSAFEGVQAGNRFHQTEDLLA